MKITDLRTQSAESVFTADVCIVGSGPAGLILAGEFAHSDTRVLVLESGSRDTEEDYTSNLNEIESIGIPRVMDQHKVRNRILGGTSHTWSGRCTPLDEIDFEPRSWVPLSGWPIGPKDLAPFAVRAAGHLGLVPLEYSESLMQQFDLPARFIEKDETDLRTVFWQFSRTSALNEDFVRFGPRFEKLSADNLSVLTNATVTHIDTDPNDRHVEELEIKAPNGVAHRVRASLFVLCGGGIENARMMLASNRYNPNGVGNANGIVGRCLMDHPRATLGTFAPEDGPKVQPEFGFFRHSSGTNLQRGVSLSFEVQRREHLLNCVTWTTQLYADNDVWAAIRAMSRNDGSDRKMLIGRILGNLDQVVTGLWQKVVMRRPLPRRMSRLNLDAIMENTPDMDSRILLSDRKDALGVPLAKIDWRIGELERNTAIRLGHAVNESLKKAGLPQAVLVDWVRDRRPEDAVFYDPAHPTGATRMSDSPSTGVVDSNCKVFGVDNLYIAGSSVFPTGGHANPTLMIGALTIRLADQMKSVLSASLAGAAQSTTKRQLVGAA